MRENGGSVVNIIANMYSGMPGMSHSGAARAGVENMTKTLAGNSIKSDSAVTNYGSANSDIFERNIPNIPLGRLGKTEEISAAVCYLLSPAAAFVSGTTIIVDGAEFLHTGRWPTSGRDNTKSYTWADDSGDPKSKL
ncbi:PECR [Bugula neritina]|uniref:Peroxisomal trans-2-enoyl-CoA reductase n=1 Tax=Bugula neritina TaxID=10212 RepID=A0A7J7JS98_BUGNE|nr:PECR [Bugula neritina]